MLPLPHVPRLQAAQQQLQNAQFQQLRPYENTPSLHNRVNQPKNQIEAMPPFKTASLASTLSPMPAFDPATTHPVFFTPNFRKPPLHMPTAPNAGLHPVATGYVFARDRGSSGVKL